MKGAALQMTQSRMLRCLYEAAVPPHRRANASWRHERRYMRLVEPPSSLYAWAIVVMMRVKVKLQNRPLEPQSAASLPSSRSYPARVKACCLPAASEVTETRVGREEAACLKLISLAFLAIIPPSR